MKNTVKESQKWLEMVTNPKARQEELHTVHSNMAGDGFRIHRDTTAPDCTCEFCTDRVPQVLNPARKQSGTVVTITNAALVTACKQAVAIGKGDKPSNDFVPPLRLSVNGSLKYAAICEGNGSVDGEWSSMTFETTRKTNFPVISIYKTAKTGGITVSTCKVEYSHEGRDLEFGINPKYLLDALSGMDETVTIKANAKNGPIYLTDGKREAVIMPVCI